MTNRSWRALAFCAALLPAAAFAEGPEDEIRARLDAWAKAFNQGDATAVCEIYADDVVTVWPGFPDGDKVATCARVGEALADPARDITYDAVIEEVLLASSGDLAAVRSTWTLGVEDAGAVTTSQERRLDIMGRDGDGVWRIHRTIGHPAEPIPPG